MTPRKKPTDSEGLGQSSGHIFISYQHDDVDFVGAMMLQLERAGIHGWIDSEHLRAGDDWRQGIDDAIRNSSALIVVMTPAAKASEYVTYEWAYGWGAGKKVIPILLKTTSLHPRLEALQYLDFTNNKHRPWERLVQRLKEIEKRADRVESHQPLPVRVVPDHIAQTIKELDSVNEGARQNAIARLVDEASNNDSHSYEALLQATDHHMYDVRVESCLRLADISHSDTRLIPALVQVLETNDWSIRRRAARALGKLRWEPPGSYMKAIFYVAIENWGKSISLGNDVVSLIEEYLESGSVNDIIGALTALYRIYGKAATQRIIYDIDKLSIEYLTDDETIRLVELVLELRTSKIVPILIRVVEEQDWLSPHRKACKAAVKALGRMKDEAAIPILARVASKRVDVFDFAREEAQKALEEIGTEQALKALREARGY